MVIVVVTAAFVVVVVADANVVAILKLVMVFETLTSGLEMSSIAAKKETHKKILSKRKKHKIFCTYHVLLKCKSEHFFN